ncbi:MAG TPA: septum formation initiator family protein [Actinomycetota bacterium]|nr:septum formation initiator family protein [Actinomycetota bacterium]
MSSRVAPNPLRIGPRGIAAILLVALVGAMAIEPTSQLLRQRDRISGMAAELEAVHESNRLLEQRIARLNNPDYIEQRARETTGLVRPGETAVVVMPPSRQAQADAEARAARKQASVPPPTPSFWESLAAFVGL